MSFGYRDQDWVDPDPDPRETWPCRLCGSFMECDCGCGRGLCNETNEWCGADDVAGCCDGANV